MMILIVAPHPDDAEIGCGGLIAYSVANEILVHVLYLTSGEHGIPGQDVEEIKKIREVEARKASMLLHYYIVDFWQLPDGKLTYSDELRDRIADTIEELNPDVVYVTHEKESHSDHRVAGRLVREALNTWESFKPPECMVYEVWTPLQKVDKVINISDYADTKLEAIRSHRSQINRQKFDVAAMSLSRFRGIMQGNCEYAEAFSRIHLNGDTGMKIAIMLLTYAPSVNHPRAEYARRTLETTLENIEPGQFNTLSLHIADDGSDPEHVKRLVEMARKRGYEPTVTNAERGGYGKSYNLACQALHNDNDLILPLEDDWELTKPLKLEYLAKALEENPDIRSIRLGYLGITQPLRGTIAFRSGMSYLLLDPDSPEPHVFCGHPRLETVEYQRDVGAWPEGIRAGETEWEITHRWPARTGVAWPLDMGIPASQDWGGMFVHIGSVSFNQDIPEGAKSV